jgi:hypothetical protein
MVGCPDLRSFSATLQQTLLAFLLASLTVCIHAYGTFRVLIPITVVLNRGSGKGFRDRPLAVLN